MWKRRRGCGCLLRSHSLARTIRLNRAPRHTSKNKRAYRPRLAVLSEAIYDSEYGHVFGCLLKPRPARLRPRTFEVSQLKANLEESNTSALRIPNTIKKWNPQKTNQTRLARVAAPATSMVSAIIVSTALVHEALRGEFWW
jgi:hypothetical protein